MTKLFCFALLYGCLLAGLPSSAGVGNSSDAFAEGPEEIETCAYLVLLADISDAKIQKIQDQLRQLSETVRTQLETAKAPTRPYASTIGQTFRYPLQGLLESVASIRFKEMVPTAEFHPDDTRRAVLVHDLKGNSLALAINNLNLLIETAGPDAIALTDAQVELLEGVFSAAQSGMRITNEILDPELRFRSAHEEFKTKLLFSNLHLYTRGWAGRTKINIEPPADDFLIRGSFSGIDRALYNLCLNAHEAMKGQADAEITVRTELIPEGRIAGQEPTYTIVFVVSDNGPGMSRKQQSDILRVGAAGNSSKGKMRGLGMSSIQLAIEEAGGDLEYESFTEPTADFDPQGNMIQVLPRGTTFRLKLLGQTLKSADNIGETPVLDQPTLLIVDDEVEGPKMLTTLIKMIAPDLGAPTLQVLTLRNADEAIRLARKNPGKIKAALIDVNGIIDDNRAQVDHQAFLERLLLADSGIRRIQSSGYMTASDPLPHYADGRLTKPSDFDDIRKIVAETVTWSRPGSRATAATRGSQRLEPSDQR